jgi:hypothetical protein
VAVVAFSMSSQAAPLHYRFLSDDEIDSDNRYPSRYHGPFYHLAPDDDIREPEVFRYFRRMDDPRYQNIHQTIELPGFGSQSPGSSSPINDQNPTKPTNVKRPGFMQLATNRLAKHVVWAKNTASGHVKMVSTKLAGHVNMACGHMKTVSAKLAGHVNTIKSKLPFTNARAARKKAQDEEMKDRMEYPI